MHLRRHVFAFTAAAGLAVAGLAVAAPTHVFAGSASGFCEDNGAGFPDGDIPIMTSPFTLGLQFGSPATGAVGYGGGPSNNSTWLQLCFAPAPNNATSEPFGGFFGGGVYNLTPQSAAVGESCISDTTATVQVNCQVGATPSYAITPGPAGSAGDLITVTIPFQVCLGPCAVAGTAAVQSTGVLVGQLTPVSTPGIGAGYQLSMLQVWVNGVEVVNLPGASVSAYVDPFSAVAQNITLFGGSTCVAGVCPAGGYLMTTNNPVVGFSIPGIGSFSEPIGHECLYNSGTTCPPG